MAIMLLDQLVVDEDFHNAFEFVAHWLPPQAAIWWGCLCLWEFEGKSASPEFESAMNGLIQWLQDPEEESTRRAMMEFESTFSLPSAHPVVMLGKAAFMSNGSIAPPQAPPVMAPRYMYAVMTAGAVKMIAAKSQPVQYVSTCKQLLRLAMEVLQGANRWN